MTNNLDHTTYIQGDNMNIEHKNLALPNIGSVWRHHVTNNLYKVTDISNLSSDRLVEYPIMITYVRQLDGTKWCRKATDWHRSYKEHLLKKGIT